VDKSGNDIGPELIFLLKQQRNLFHQLKMLTADQSVFAKVDSPEKILKIVTGRRKLVEKIHKLSNQLSPLKSNWSSIRTRILPEHKNDAIQMAEEVRSLIGQIRSTASQEVYSGLPLGETEKMAETFAEQNGQNKSETRE
jgi:hypothetical protein